MSLGGRLVAIAVAALALGAPAAAAAQSSPAADRARARTILEQRRFQGTDLPRPLQKPLEWLGDRLEPVFDWIDDRGTTVPGGPIVLWTILAVLLLLAVSGVTATSIRRRALAIERERAAALPASEDPGALERAAEEAEREGDWEHAVRLRFRAGLLRLDRRRILDYRPSLTTGEVARAIHAPAATSSATATATANAARRRRRSRRSTRRTPGAGTSARCRRTTSRRCGRSLRAATHSTRRRGRGSRPTSPTGCGRS